MPAVVLAKAGDSWAEHSSFSLLPSAKKECFGEPPKSTREPRMLPRLSGLLFGVIRRVWRIIKILRSDYRNEMAQFILNVTGRRDRVSDLFSQ
jgi:hypothetical protein